jgi:hypothetical protein
MIRFGKNPGWTTKTDDFPEPTGSSLKSSPASKGRPVLSRLLCVALFAIAMGFLEAICVIYLRGKLFSDGTDTPEIVAQLGSFGIEHVREACTIVMLLTVAWLAASGFRTRTAMFFLMFGVWDITYYLGLRVFSGWPGSLLEWDCLFLIPVPWFGPVLAPVLISVFMVVSCVLLILREASGSGLRMTWPVLALVGSGFVLWYWSFVEDSETIMASGYPGVMYSWPLFFGGMFFAVSGFIVAARTSPVMENTKRP